MALGGVPFLFLFQQPMGANGCHPGCRSRHWGWRELVLQRVRLFAAILAPNKHQLPLPWLPIELLGVGGNWHSQGCHSCCCYWGLTGANSHHPWLPIEAHEGGESWYPQGTLFALTLALERYQSLPPWLPIAAHADLGNRSPWKHFSCVHFGAQRAPILATQWMAPTTAICGT